VDSLKVLDPERPIREADIHSTPVVVPGSCSLAMASRDHGGVMWPLLAPGKI
jgi:hypothetical protein